MEIEAVLEANKNLSKKIKKLEAELKLCLIYKERFDMASREIKALRDDLLRKHNSVRVTKVKENISYVMQISKLHDTPEGLFVEIKD